jgi:hypothetical protein
MRKSKSDGQKQPLKDSLDFLITVFPTDGVKALPYAKSVSITAQALGAEYVEGVVLDLPGKPKTLYVDSKSAASLSMRERCVPFLLLYLYLLICHGRIMVVGFAPL